MSMKTVSIFDRFWSKVNKTEECWLWVGAERAKGYGAFKLNKKVELAHRVAYVLATGQEINKDQVVMHKCDNPPCVNPSHLKLATQRENVLDACSKGRQTVPIGSRFKPGLDHPYAKLSKEDVDKIMQLKEDGMSYRAISKLFDIDHSRVYQIVKNKSCYYRNI